MKHNDELIRCFMDITPRRCKSINFMKWNCEHFIFLHNRLITTTVKFDSDWNWLIPVVNKITQTCKGTKIYEELDKKWSYMFDHNCYPFFENNISKIYDAVIDFIVWYNEYKKEQKQVI